MWAIEHGVDRTMHVIIYFKCLSQICTKMNGFKFDFSKICWGRRSPSPLPRPSPFFQALLSVWASPSILSRFAPSTRASPSILGRFAPWIRALHSTFVWRCWLGPQNKWIRPWLNGSPSKFLPTSLNRDKLCLWMCDLKAAGDAAETIELGREFLTETTRFEKKFSGCLI